MGPRGVDPMVNKLRYWWRFRRESRRFAADFEQATRWKREALRCLQDLSRSTKRLEQLLARVQEEAEDVAEKLADTDKLVKSYDYAEEALNNKLLVMEEALKDMTLLREMTREQVKADIAVHAARQEALAHTERRDE